MSNGGGRACVRGGGGGGGGGGGALSHPEDVFSHLGPVEERELLVRAEVAQLDLLARAVALELEEHALAAEDEAVAVLAHDEVDDALARERRELRVRLVRSDDVVDAALAQRADQLAHHRVRHADRLPEELLRGRAVAAPRRLERLGFVVLARPARERFSRRRHAGEKRARGAGCARCAPDLRRSSQSSRLSGCVAPSNTSIGRTPFVRSSSTRSRQKRTYLQERPRETGPRQRTPPATRCPSEAAERTRALVGVDALRELGRAAVRAAVEPSMCVHARHEALVILEPDRARDASQVLQQPLDPCQTQFVNASRGDTARGRGAHP